MLVTKRDMFTGKDNTLDLPVTQAQIAAWQKGMVAQLAFPNLSADQREFIISGTMPGEFERNLSFPIKRQGFDWSRHEIKEGLEIPSAEASTVGLPPGEWPDFISFDDGEREVFEFKEDINDGDGELLAVIYCSLEDKTNIKIYND